LKDRAKSRAAKAGIATGLAMRAWNLARQIDWDTVWLRARWLARHSRRLYNNLDEAERREFMEMVVPKRGARNLGAVERDRLRFLVTKAFTGNGPGR
jgi:hypothetical protein